MLRQLVLLGALVYSEGMLFSKRAIGSSLSGEDSRSFLSKEDVSDSGSRKLPSKRAGHSSLSKERVHSSLSEEHKVYKAGALR